MCKYFNTFNTIAIICLFSFLFIYPAILNGFPLIFADTGTYIRCAHEMFVPWERSFFYGLFIKIFCIKGRLFTVILMQALIFCITCYYAVFSFTSDQVLKKYQLLMSVLLLFSTAPWYLSQLMPDYSAGIIILVLAIIWCKPTIKRNDILISSLILVVMLPQHTTNILTSLSITFILLIISLLLKRKHEVIKRLSICIITSVLSASLLITASYIGFKKINLVAYGNVMLLSRLMDGGVALEYLNKNCNNVEYPVCTVLNEINKLYNKEVSSGYKPGYASDHFLWGGINSKIGDFPETQKYASEIIKKSLLANPVKFIKDSLYASLIQAKTLTMGQGFVPATRGSPTWQAIKQYHSRWLKRYEKSVQNRGSFVFTYLNIIYGSIVVLSIIVFCITLINFKNRDALLIITTCLISYIISAAICGSLSAVFDRYTSRITWIFPATMILALYISMERGAGKRKAQHKK